jgi:hypothetical protein
LQAQFPRNFGRLQTHLWQASPVLGFLTWFC